MKIPVTSNIEKFYSQIIQLLSSFAPIKKLFPKEQELLAEIMYQNYLLKDIDEHNRFIIMFSSISRKKMRARLDMSENAFNVHLSGIKKQGLVSEDNKLAVYLARILPKDEFDFTVIFKLKEHE